MTIQNALDKCKSSRPDDTRCLDERDIVAASETLRNLAFGLDTVEQVEARLEVMPPRELRAMIVARMLEQRFEIHTRHHRPEYGPAALEAYDRFAGHLGLGSHLEAEG